MEEINLLQNRVRDHSQLWQRQSKLIVGSLSVILALLLGVAGLFYLLGSSVQKNIEALNSETAKINDTMDAKKKTLGDATTFQAELANLKALYAQHTILSPLLDELGKATYQKVQFETLDVVGSSKIHIEGRVANYNDLGKMLLGFSTSPSFSDVKLSSVIPDTGQVVGYVFAIDMKANPNIFTKK